MPCKESGCRNFHPNSWGRIPSFLREQDHKIGLPREEAQYADSRITAHLPAASL